MKPFHTFFVSITLAAGLLAPVSSQAFSFGSFNFGDSWGDSWGDHWGDGWHNNWGDRWQTNPRWGGYPPPRWNDPRWDDPRWDHGWGNSFRGPRFNFGDGDGFHWGNRPRPYPYYAPGRVAPPW